MHLSDAENLPLGAYAIMCIHCSIYMGMRVQKEREMIHIGAYAPKGKINIFFWNEGQINITCIFHCVLFLHMFVLNQFNSQVQDKATQLDSSLPFEFCYSIRYFYLVTIPHNYIYTYCSMYAWWICCCTLQSKGFCQSSKHKFDGERWKHISCQWSNNYHYGRCICKIELALYSICLFVYLYPCKWVC